MRVAIAGGGTGIGAACARALVGAGHRVLACARTARELEALRAQAASGSSLFTLTADLSTEEGAAAFAEEAFAKLGGVDAALVSLGAAHPSVRMCDATRVVLLEQLTQNTIAPALAAGALVRAWERHPEPGADRRLLVLSSLSTRRPPIPGTGPYTIAKAALEQLVRQLAEEAFPVRVNALCLGPVDTRLHAIAGTPAGLRARFPSPEEAAVRVVELLLDGLAGQSARVIDEEALALDPQAGLWGAGSLAFVEPLQAHVQGEAPPEAEPGRRPSPKVRAAVRGASADLHRHPVDTGSLLHALAGLHAVDPAQVVVSGGGATELLERSLRALCAPGDEVVSPFPTFEVLSALCSRLGLRHRPVPSPRRPDGLFENLSARPLLAALGPRTRVVYVAAPDSPTGAALPEGALADLLAGLPEGVALVLDEAWSLSTPGPARSGARAPLIRLRSFSKLFGLAGLRLGYALAPPGLAALLSKLALPFPLGAPQLAAALATLGDLPRARRAALLLARERARVAGEIRALGLLVNESEAPVLLVRRPERGASAGPLIFAVRAAGLPVQEAHWDPAALVLALGPRPQNRRLVAALRRSLQ